MKNHKSNGFIEAFREALDLVVARENRRLSLAWVTCVLIVLALGMRSGNDSSTLIGIADSRESVINFDHPVTVKRVTVMSGQAVRKGELLAELEQPELESRMETLRFHINKLVTEAHQGSKRTSLAAEIESLREELEGLEGRERRLYVFSQISGVVGTVNYKKGESVAPYAPILTVSPSTPSYIDGFVHESLHTKVRVGQKVIITSPSDSEKEVEGKIISIGSRIVELPVRIGRTQTMRAWGREIAVEIPNSNPFLLGEKVEIHQPFSLFSLQSARAGESDALAKKSSLPAVPLQVTVPESIQKVSAFEPSGALYIRDLKKFLVISDDTDEARTPYVFLMTSDGVVDEKPIRIEGISDLSDLESIVNGDDGEIYFISSQSLTKKKKEKRNRNLIVQVKREGIRFRATGELELRPMLLSALEKSTVPEIKAISGKLAKKLEIEGAYVAEGRLHVGLKKPQLADGRSAILDLGPIRSLMSAKKIDPATIKIAHLLSFPTTGEKNTRMSDITQVGRELIVTTVSFADDDTAVGRLWSLNLDSKKLQKLDEYRGNSPEAVTFDADNRDLMVLFDQKSKPAQYFRNSSLRL